jgi:hypothetical protein
MTDKPVRPWDILKSNKGFIPEYVKEERLKICHSCEDLIKLTGMCKHCGCIMKLKTTLAEANCPKAKWRKVVPSITAPDAIQDDGLPKR